MTNPTCAQCKFLRISGCTPERFQGRCVKSAPAPEFAQVDPHATWCGDFTQCSIEEFMANQGDFYGGSYSTRLVSLYNGRQRRALQADDAGKVCSINNTPAVFIGFARHDWIVGQAILGGAILHTPSHNGDIEL